MAHERERLVPYRVVKFLESIIVYFVLVVERFIEQFTRTEIQVNRYFLKFIFNS